MNNKKYVRQKISYLLCALAGIWIVFKVFLHEEELNTFSLWSLSLIGLMVAFFNSYFYLRARKKDKSKWKSKLNLDYKRQELDNLNESFKQGQITIEEYKKRSKELLSKN